MNIIALLKAMAFLSAIVVKIIGFPFVLMGRIIKSCVRRVHKEKEPKTVKAGKLTGIKEKLLPRECDGAIVRTFKRIFWISFTILNKCFWIGHSIARKIYWRTRWIGQKIYWFCYPRVKTLYRYLSRNEYMDLFLIFLRGYMRRKPVDINGVKICGVKDFVKKSRTEGEYHIIEPGKMRTVCIPEYFEKSKEEIKEYFSPEIYLARLSNVLIIGGSNVVIAENKLLNDAVYYDKEKRVDIRYSAIKKQYGDIALVETGSVECTIERGINLIGGASFNYYHLVVEILSRLTFVDYYEQYRDYPVLVDEIVLKIPQFHAALDMINKRGHSVISLGKGKNYLVEDLIIPSSNVWMPTNVYDRYTIRPDDFLIAETVLNNIRASVKLYTQKQPWRKIFISRKNTQALRLKNEAEVREIFRQAGFEIIYTEEMTFEQQIECFGQARIVVASSGAALTNMIFCQPGAMLGCIIPSAHRFYMYSTIAYLLGLRTLFLDAEITELTPYAASDTFELDLEYAERYIKYLACEGERK